MIDGRDTEPARRVMASVCQWGGWLSTVGFGLYAVVEFDPNHGHFAPQWVTFVWIFSMGVAIAGTLVRSRMRLTKTILSAFSAGQAAARGAAADEVRDTLASLDARVTRNSHKIETEGACAKGLQDTSTPSESRQEAEVDHHSN
jgi:hypothetical protein